MSGMGEYTGRSLCSLDGLRWIQSRTQTGFATLPRDICVLIAHYGGPRWATLITRPNSGGTGYRSDILTGSLENTDISTGHLIPTKAFYHLYRGSRELLLQTRPYSTIAAADLFDRHGQLIKAWPQTGQWYTRMCGILLGERGEYLWVTLNNPPSGDIPKGYGVVFESGQVIAHATRLDAYGQRLAVLSRDYPTCKQRLMVYNNHGTRLLDRPVKWTTRSTLTVDNNLTIVLRREILTGHDLRQKAPFRLAIRNSNLRDGTCYNKNLCEREIRRDGDYLVGDLDNCPEVQAECAAVGRLNIWGHQRLDLRVGWAERVWLRGKFNGLPPEDFHIYHE